MLLRLLPEGTTASSIFCFSATPNGSGGEACPSLGPHKRSRPETSETLVNSKTQLDSNVVMDSDNSCEPTKPVSYAATLIQPLGARSLNSEVMLGDFVLEDADVQVSEGPGGPDIRFSQKVEAKLNFEWNCAVIVKLMGKPNSENAYKFMFDGLNRKWVTKGPWQLVDLPNGFFAVKFQLFEDMDYALCNGPWIIAGQTLVVQKWDPNFDPLVDKISRMAVWVRILDLPVKYYKEFALKTIGGLIGPVVKIDKVTLAQTRGKLCRLCVEINLNEPLKPFINLYGKPYGVVYEGISTICFNCGVYGHVREQCPYKSENQYDVKEPTKPTAETSTEPADPNLVDVSMLNPEDGLNSYTKDQSAPKPKSNANVGPWMVMSYRNRKKNFNASPSRNGKPSQGSRFAPLQDDIVNSNDVNPEPAVPVDLQPSQPTIVKLWQNMQDKLKTGNYKKTKSGKQAVISTGLVGEATMSSLKPTPLKDISNVASSSKSTFVAKAKLSKSHTILVRDKAPATVVKSPFPIKCDFSNCGSEFQPFTSLDAQFGHSPPEEGIGTTCVVPASSSGPRPVNDDEVVNAIDDANVVNDLSSSDEEDMEDNLSSSNEEDMITA